MSHPILNDAQAKMKKAVDHTLHEFSAIHTGKATPAMVEGVMVEAYGSQMSAQGMRRDHDPRRPADPDPALGRGPGEGGREGRSRGQPGLQSDHRRQAVRIPLPDMSRERRQEFVKTAHGLAEEGRVQVRNVRRDSLEAVKKAKLPEDEAKRLEKDIQAATDRSIKEINDQLAAKEKELLTF